MACRAGSESALGGLPAGRWGGGDDLAFAALLLASRASDFVSGAAIPVDGGYHICDRSLAAYVGAS